jgi:hypothetical protein
MLLAGWHPRSAEHPAQRGWALPMRACKCLTGESRERRRANFAGVRSWTAKSTLDLSQVQRSRPIASRKVTRLQRAEPSEFCVGLRLDQRGCRFRQSTAAIGSDQQTMTPFCKASSISLRISAGQS